ncbi:hypothetical protein [Microbispora sp. GKU 823]|uniref:hypothetical protein n=1 Tax=Microbispora sp. GKU 823 TaxID=1652100 RepID=UPI0015C4E34D|nr:hypothetical protein [Microbispora sp. GKU 823]
MKYICEACKERIEPDPRGKIRVEGVTHSSAPEGMGLGASAVSPGLPPVPEDAV